MREPGQIEFVSNPPRLHLVAWLGQEPPTVTGGYGGWEKIARPRRLAITRWSGREPYQMSVPIVIDGFAENESIEVEISRLERMALPHPNPGGEPPLIKINGPVPHDDLIWVIDSILWASSWRRRRDGHRIRQEATVNLIDYVAEDVLGKKNAAARARERAVRGEAKNVAGYRTYVVKKGDTLPRIAAKQLGDANRWREIARINNIRDPYHLKVGTRLKIPAR
jgi:hypothetical protein